MAKKQKLQKIDGLGPIDEKRLRTAIRQVWSWNYARKLCIERATDRDGFGHCENEECKSKVPKLYADHIEPVGTFNARTFIERMFIPSKQLQALCKKCHDVKTREEKNLNDSKDLTFL